MMLFACKCGTIAAFEDERQACQKTWPDCLQLLKDAGVALVVFNGGKDTPKGFHGVN
jgi:hypothetical protein